ncbi:Transposase [Tistlia consotensis]|uniref:Transposase n=1 Tax=Tistlia consotensis USBA 355 TaxID=560819 RepID=A0A1Y6B9I4_9PROT|nr:IS1595 family transposase [Tistlia consotensis]SMF00098.1 Transposase [Tistlia consotensis USBA 355]SNR76284.1 Transposase [Tistlia consotensis]
MSVLSAPHFHDEQAAYEFVEARVWPNGRVCPHCGVVDRSGPLKGKSTRIGTYKCYACRKPFTVKIGTIFEASHVKLHLWLQAIALMCASKKGISSNQLHRTLGVTLKTAWFMSHRIREATRDGDFSPFGGSGGDVEVDETFIWRDPDARPTPKHAHATWVEKIKVLSLVDRESGRARSYVVDSLSAKDVQPILSANIAKEARLLTDEAPRYIKFGRQFAAHGSVNHKKDEYVSREDPTIHTNTIEGYFSVFKRGMKGTYQHCAKRHMHRYLAEFDFRYNHRIANGYDDQERAERALKGVVGKRLTYRTTNREVSANG